MAKYKPGDILSRIDKHHDHVQTMIITKVYNEHYSAFAPDNWWRGKDIYAPDIERNYAIIEDGPELELARILYG